MSRPLLSRPLAIPRLQLRPFRLLLLRQPAAAQPAAGQPAAAQPAAAAPAVVPASSGSVGLADVRRLWPEILEAVKSKRRFAWIMLSQNAQVIAIDEQTLTLGLVNAGARESFARSGSDEILREAMIDTIGLTRRVEAVVDPSADPGAGGPAAPPPAPPSAPSSSWDSAPAASTPTNQAPQSAPGTYAPADARRPAKLRIQRTTRRRSGYTGRRLRCTAGRRFGCPRQPSS